MHFIFLLRGLTNMKYSKKGFTLAEVLITLGIIGVVAALTIPTLMANHRKTVVETRLAKFYSSINQAIQMAEADYGDKSQWDEFLNGYETDEDGNNTTTSKSLPWFEKYLKPYLQYTKYEVDTRGSEGKISVYFPDGSLVLISSSSFIFYPNAKDYNLIEKEGSNYLIRNNNDSGIKWFTFFFNPTYTSSSNKTANNGVEPYKIGWDGTREMLLNNPSIGCRENTTRERAYCAALIQMNGWKIPKDYPLRF